MSGPAPGTLAGSDRPDTAGTALARLAAHAADRPSAVAIRDKELGRWREITWRVLADDVARAAAGLSSLGFAPGERVALIVDNQPEWVVADLALRSLGAVSVAVYPMWPAGLVAALVERTRCAGAVVAGEEQLAKVGGTGPADRVWRGVVAIGVADHTLGEGVVGWDALLARAPAPPPGPVHSPAPGDPATIACTPGTIGEPVPVLLTHGNLEAAARTVIGAAALHRGDQLLSFLPMAFVPERVLSVDASIGAGCTVHFGEGGESFATDLGEVEPTVLLGVPRVWERMLTTVAARSASASRLKRSVFERFWRPSSRPSPIGAALLHRPLRRRLGLRRVRVAICAAAAPAQPVRQRFALLGVPLSESYGLAEASGIVALTPPPGARDAPTISGASLGFSGDEVVVRGAQVAAAVLDDQGAEQPVLAPDGTLHTGDVGALVDGRLAVLGPSADRFTTASGAVVMASVVEDRLRASPIVRDVVVAGEARPAPAALVAIEYDAVSDAVGRLGVSVGTYAELASLPETRALVQDVVDDVNATLAPAERLAGFALLDEPLSEERGELTPLRRVRRVAVLERFGSRLEPVWGAEPAAAPGGAAR